MRVRMKKTQAVIHLSSKRKSNIRLREKLLCLKKVRSKVRFSSHIKYSIYPPILAVVNYFFRWYDVAGQWDEYLLSILSNGTAHWIASHQSDPYYNQDRLKAFLRERCCLFVTCFTSPTCPQDHTIPLNVYY